MGVLLAALVVIVMTVTGWRVVARDMAALHMSGVPLRCCARALVREQVILVLVGSVVGLGLRRCELGARHAPASPLRHTADPVPALQLAPAVPVSRRVPRWSPPSCWWSSGGWPRRAPGAGSRCNG